MECNDRDKYVRLAELKSVVSFLLSCEYPVSAYSVYLNTGVTAANLAWIVEKLDHIGIVTIGEDAIINLPTDRSQLFSLGRILRMSKIRRLLDRIPDVMTTGNITKEIDTLPPTWRLHRGEKD